MANRLTKRSVIQYTPGVPTVIAQPAYCVTQVQSVPFYVYTPSSVAPFLGATDGSALSDGSTATQSTVGYANLAQVYYRNVETLVCYPAVPGVVGREAATETDAQLGWNAGGRSQTPLAGDGLINFQIPGTPAGVLAGLGPAGATIGDFAAVEHGLYTDGAVLQAYEGGVLRHTFATAASLHPALSLLRTGSQVTYRVGSERYVSSSPSLGSKSLLAALYAAGDSVDAPTVVPGVGVSGRSSWDLGGAPAGHLSGRSTWSWAGAGALGTNEAAQPPVPTAIAGESLVPLFAAGLVQDVELMDASVPLPLVLLGSDYDYLGGAADLTLGVLSFEGEERATGSVPTSQSVDLIEGLGLIARNRDVPRFYAALDESLVVGDSLTLVVALDAELFEGLLLRNQLTLSAILQATLASGLSLSDQAAQARAEALQYAVNLATGGVTRYQGFDFLGFARAGLDTYAVRADGLYRLGADAGMLDALIDFAAEDFGTSSQKYLDSLYLGLSSDGEVLAQITDDRGRAFTYRVQGESPSLRVPVGRGLHSRLFELRLTLQDAQDIQLETVEWAAAASTRRLTRGQR